MFRGLKEVYESGGWAGRAVWAHRRHAAGAAEGGVFRHRRPTCSAPTCPLQLRRCGAAAAAAWDEPPGSLAALQRTQQCRSFGGSGSGAAGSGASSSSNAVITQTTTFLRNLHNSAEVRRQNRGDRQCTACLQAGPDGGVLCPWRALPAPPRTLQAPTSAHPASACLQIFLVGTAHVSKQSAEEVRKR